MGFQYKAHNPDEKKHSKAIFKAFKQSAETFKAKKSVLREVRYFDKSKLNKVDTTISNDVKVIADEESVSSEKLITPPYAINNKSTIKSKALRNIIGKIKNFFAFLFRMPVSKIFRINISQEVKLRQKVLKKRHSSKANQVGNNANLASGAAQNIPQNNQQSQQQLNSQSDSSNKSNALMKELKRKLANRISKNDRGK